MSGWFKGISGEWYSPEERKKQARVSKLLRSKGLYRPTGKCNRCGQTEGKVSYHNHDYSDPVQFLEELCWRCHMVVHAEVYAKPACDKYWEEIKNGKVYEPLPFGNWKQLAAWHGIKRPFGFGKITPPDYVLKKYDKNGLRPDRTYKTPFTIKKCEKCGQIHGIMRTNYKDTGNETLCYRCFILEKGKDRWPKAYADYVSKVKYGPMKPIYEEGNHAIFTKEHGVNVNEAAGGADVMPF